MEDSEDVLLQRGFILSRPFFSYLPKHFPGLIDSTPLSRLFAEQGLKIRVRKEQRTRFAF